VQSWSDLDAALNNLLVATTPSGHNLETRKQVTPTQQAPVVTMDDANTV
jgi:hypothetical protein